MKSRRFKTKNGTWKTRKSPNSTSKSKKKLKAYTIFLADPVNKKKVKEFTLHAYNNTDARRRLKAGIPDMNL